MTAYAHRAEVPNDLWLGLLSGAREQIDILGYAVPFVFELTPGIGDLIAEKCANGARIRNAFTMLGSIGGIEGVQVGTHSVYLHNSWFRFDNQAIATPHLFRYRGYQHPALHLRRLSAFGIFETFAEQFHQVWETVQVREVSS